MARIPRLLLIGTSSATDDALKQLIRPDSDVTTANWVAVPSGSYYSTVDEAVVSDADYSYTLATGATLEFTLSNAVTPLELTNHTLTYRGLGDYTVSLRQGSSTQIASWVESDVSLTTHERTLTTGEANSITDYSDLRIRIVSG